ncbi:MAG: hypothetical protein U0T75_04055 [Chitinophagales bacterium]
MRMRPAIKALLSVLFTMAILFTVSVKEVHYLFAEHGSHEHCENHLHSGDEHGSCEVCKFDMATFTDAIARESVLVPQEWHITAVYNYQGFEVLASPGTINLRGPPALTYW